jgi:transcriptional regulator with XRE-family HTH domain
MCAFGQGDYTSERVHDPVVKETLGDVVRELRQRRGMSQGHLAAVSNVSSGTISNWELGARGKRPRRDTVIAVAQGLRVDSADRKRLLAAAGLDTDHLDDDGDGGVPAVISAINADTRLRSDQKAGLINVYVSMVGRSPS